MHRVAVLALDGVYPFELGIPQRVFGSAEGRYEIRTCTVDGEPVRSDADFMISVDHGPELLRTADTVVLPPFDLRVLADGLDQQITRALGEIRRGTRIVSICTGAFVLAAAGMLDGRPATTHWRLAEHFRSAFPAVQLDPDVLFVEDGDLLTSAGAASGIDVCLHVIRSDHGSDLANRVARACVVPPFRDGGQAQYIEQPVPEATGLGTTATRAWAYENLHLPLTVSELAEHARMSSRTFARRFRDEVGISPGKWLTQQRLARARQLLETTDLSIDQIATRVGFANAASLRQHLRATIGISPLTYRRTFRTEALAS